METVDIPDTTTGDSLPGDLQERDGEDDEKDLHTSDYVSHECCTVDEECPQNNMVCVIRPGQVEGVCYWRGGSSSCYSTADCNEYHVCIGAELPLCEDGTMPERGYCAAIDAGCCLEDSDCPETTHCVGEAQGGGTCLPDLPYWLCWEDDECGEDESCYLQRWCPCDADCDFVNRSGSCKPNEFLDCVYKHSGCGCVEGCVDGFGVTVWYPASAGTFPEDISPPQELLEVAVAMYECSVCTCTESWYFRPDPVDIVLPEDDQLWPVMDADNFCHDLLKYQEQCDQCLISWFGGCC